ncbi:MAG: DUF695 domain-containing protein [Flavobacteriales bacterium]|nr:DUF695 domain-containing protein [Flavobacteriales bacterium]
MKSEFQYLYKIEDEVDSIIRSNTKLELAGTFTYQCERLNYFYVADTSRIRSQLTKFYQESYSRYKFYVNIKLDNNWDGYLKFLYPNEETREFISNNRVIEQLQLAGDNLTKKRQVDHWVYFQTAGSRKLFTEYAVSQGFNVEGEEEIEDPLFSFQLRISREDFVNVKSISEITLTLREKAKEMNGDYDGWETVVVIEE